MTIRNATRTLTLSLVVHLAVGCGTYQAYPGKKRPREDVARLDVWATGLSIDGQQLDQKDARKIALLPGRHELHWKHEYSNKYLEQKTLSFVAEAGRHYRLGERFFAEPNPAGPLGDVFDLAVDAALTPITMVLPLEPPSGPPPGQYYAWILDIQSQQIVAGLAPDVPMDHAPITYVPLDDPE